VAIVNVVIELLHVNFNFLLFCFCPAGEVLEKWVASVRQSLEKLEIGEHAASADDVVVRDVDVVHFFRRFEKSRWNLLIRKSKIRAFLPVSYQLQTGRQISAKNRLRKRSESEFFFE
jgi:hypothetical protein